MYYRRSKCKNTDRAENKGYDAGKKVCGIKSHIAVDTSGMLCDGGYTGEKFAKRVNETIGSRVEIAKRSEFHKFIVILKRWVVERTFSWL